MKNKVFIAVIMFCVFCLSGCGEKKEEVKEEALPTARPTVKIENKDWKDEAGFVFSYPENVTVKQEESSTRYANLVIGAIKIYAEDTKYKKVADWAKSLKGEKEEKLTIRGKDAMSVTIGEKQVIGVIDEGIIFVIERTGSADKELLDQIVDSFEFYYPTMAPAAVQKGTSVNSEESVIEEEEIIE